MLSHFLANIHRFHTPKTTQQCMHVQCSPEGMAETQAPPLSALSHAPGMLMPALGVSGPAYSHTRSWLPIHGARKDSQPQCCCRGLPAASL